MNNVEHVCQCVMTLPYEFCFSEERTSTASSSSSFENNDANEHLLDFVVTTVDQIDFSLYNAFESITNRVSIKWYLCTYLSTYVMVKFGKRIFLLLKFCVKSSLANFEFEKMSLWFHVKSHVAEKFLIMHTVSHKDRHAAIEAFFAPAARIFSDTYRLMGLSIVTSPFVGSIAK